MTDKGDLCVIEVSAKTVHLGRITRVDGDNVVEAESLDNRRHYRDVDTFHTLSFTDPDKVIAAGVFRFKNIDHAREHIGQFRSTPHGQE